MRKIFLLIIMLILVVPISALASDGSLAKIGNNYFDSLTDAIMYSKSGDTITLVNDSKVDETLLINKNVKIDLNGHDISAKEMVFKVQGGALHLTGNGKIYETSPNYGAIMIYGSTLDSDVDYSVVKIDKGVKLEGWSGIFINHDSSKAYGILINFDGVINAVNDTNNNTGIGIYANGNIKHNSNYPVVNIGDNAKITSTGNGIYMAGYMEVNVNGGYIQGDESAIGIKSGILNINDGSIVSTGVDKTPSSGNNNGINASGTAIQVESNTGYAGNMKIDINGGFIKSKNSYAFYEYIGKGNNSLVSSIDISSGQFESSKDNFYVSDSFKSNNQKFIKGGTYTSNPSEFLDSEYTAALNDNNLYEVHLATFSQVSKIENNNSNLLFYLSLLILLPGLVFLVYQIKSRKNI